jgi:uncharacterized caspase-like protein
LQQKQIVKVGDLGHTQTSRALAFCLSMIEAIAGDNPSAKRDDNMSRHRIHALTIAFWIFALLLNGDPAHASGRVALVIGNGAYKLVPKLASPQDDAHAVAALLKSIGFDVVEGTDLTRDRMAGLLLDFGRKADGADLAIFYYAGQGIAVEATNYILPIDADIRTLADIKLGAAINMDDALEETMASAKVKLVLLDASRTDPFSSTGEPQVKARAGLAEMKSADGTLIAYASGPGQPALDGPKGGRSPFTQALLDNIAQPGIEIQEAMTLVRAEVAERTNSRQMPWGNSNLAGKIYLNPKAP